MNKYFEFLQMIRRIENQGGGFYYFTFTNDDFCFLKLPNNYCRLTGSYESGNTFSLDITLFDKYPKLLETKEGKEIKKGYDYYIGHIKYKAFIDGESEDNIEISNYYPIPINRGIYIKGNTQQIKD